MTDPPNGRFYEKEEKLVFSKSFNLFSIFGDSMVRALEPQDLSSNVHFTTYALCDTVPTNVTICASFFSLVKEK